MDVFYKKQFISCQTDKDKDWNKMNFAKKVGTLKGKEWPPVGSFKYWICGAVSQFLTAAAARPVKRSLIWNVYMIEKWDISDKGYQKEPFCTCITSMLCNCCISLYLFNSLGDNHAVSLPKENGRVQRKTDDTLRESCLLGKSKQHHTGTFYNSGDHRKTEKASFSF